MEMTFTLHLCSPGDKDGVRPLQISVDFETALYARFLRPDERHLSTGSQFVDG